MRENHVPGGGASPELGTVPLGAGAVKLHTQTLESRKVRQVFEQS